MSTSFEPQLNSQSEMSNQTREMLIGASTAARAGVVNRTHRVVRQRAKVMQERRNQVRSLMVPLIICSALLILVIVAVWSGLYQNEAAEAAEAVQADVAALAATDANNHFLVVLLWFVPVSLAALAAVWLSRVRGGTDHRTTR
jgi:NADH:ubiquinone oxidoreductase subunit 6 (subunit J)